MQKESAKFENSTWLEGMTSLRALFSARQAGVNDRPILRVLYDEARTKKLTRDLAFLRREAEKVGFPLIPAPREEIDALALGSSHGGILAECGERSYSALGGVIDRLPDGFYVMIQGIEDPYNFGYALRSLYATGVDGIILSPRNWLSAAGVVTRASAGASELFPVYLAEPEEAVRLFKAKGHTVVCADENTEHSLFNTPLKKPLFLLVGGERRGISRTLLDEADTVVKIEYARPFRASLSAASAATILAYEIMRQNQE